jgi:hypothetical protein
MQLLLNCMGSNEEPDLDRHKVPIVTTVVSEDYDYNDISRLLLVTCKKWRLKISKIYGKIRISWV